jgi:signal transduction histidine kinase
MMDRALETIERNANAQTRLIEDLLDVSWIIAGKVNLELRPFEFVPLIELTLDAVRPGRLRRQHVVELAAAAELPSSPSRP